jgi:NitT/TauT family transport system permease protein
MEQDYRRTSTGLVEADAERTVAKAKASRPGTSAAGQRRSGRLRSRGALLWLIRIVILCVIFGVWQLVSGRWLDPFFVSRPSAVFARDGHLLGSDLLYSNLKVTIVETAWGYVLGAVTATAVGFTLGRIRLLGDASEPLFSAFFSIPKIAVAPLMIVWFGIGFRTDVALSAVLTFYVVFWNAFSGARDVDEDLINAVRLMGAKRSTLLRTVIVPSALGWVITGLRMAVPYALLGAVVGELLAGNQGLGFLLEDYSQGFDTAGVFSILIILMVIGGGLNFAVVWIERYTQRWKRPAL